MISLDIDHPYLKLNIKKEKIGDKICSVVKTKWFNNNYEQKVK